MKAFCLSILLLAFCAPALQQILHIPHEEMPHHEVTPRPAWNISEVPTNFTWTNHNGKNYITMVRNHHLPQYCGGCYAFGSTTTLTDRIKIMRDAAFPDIIIAPQMALSCTPNHGCHGGNPILVYDYARKYGMTDETCSPYRAKGHENGAPCTDELKCSVCDSEGNCKVPDSYPVYYVKEFGHLRGGEKMMMLEIFHRGPIACMLESTHIWNYTGGIIKAFYEEYDFDHVAEVVGFGEDENGTPYWLAKNSWGSFWGEDGFFRVHRGNNSLGIETSCFWVIPEHNFTRRNYTNVSKEESSDEEIASNAFLAEIPAPKDSCLKYDPKYTEFTSLSGNASFIYNVKHYELPAIWDWRNVNGTNFLSWTRSENAIRYCAACWVDATTSALADRIMIKRNSTFPQIGLSVQSVINCQGGGNCSGGDPMGVYEFAYGHGIPEDSCQVYTGVENIAPNCSGVFVCGGCHPPAPRFAWSVNPNKCKAVNNFTNWKVSDYGRVSGVEHMKKAIYADGPIACTMAVTPEFEKYTHGVFSQAPVRGGRVANHVVSVVGWGPNKDGSEHWVVRNSWGSHWGEHGFFRIHMGRHNLGIENNCYWATPIVDDVVEEEYYSSDFDPSDFETIGF